MASITYTYWQDDEMWLGYMDEYPDYMTQGESEEELRENLQDIYSEIQAGHIPAVRRHGELEVA
jgi:predicted RNase H-like HicB family nuclease